MKYCGLLWGHAGLDDLRYSKFLATRNGKFKPIDCLFPVECPQSNEQCLGTGSEAAILIRWKSSKMSGLNQSLFALV